MATVTVFTAEKMEELANANVVNGEIVGDDLILTQRDGTEINAGVVVGPQGEQGDVGSPNPPGSILLYGGDTAPAGYVFAAGQVLSRATYDDLFTAFGTKYNTGGEAGTDFRMPNLNGKVPVGLDAAQTEFNTLGESGGSKTVTLGIGEIPTHTHAPTATPIANHTHPYDNWTFVSVASGAGASVLSTPRQFGTDTTGGAGAHTPDISIANAGGGGSHQNLQPYLVLNYIIKT